MTTLTIGFNYHRDCVVIVRKKERDLIEISAYTLPLIGPANLKWAWPEFKMTDEQAESLLQHARNMAFAAGKRHPWQQAMPDPIEVEV